jgi:hypothetical protein
MSVVQQMTTHEERRAYVRFERVAIENKAESLKQGKWVGRDVDMAYITPPDSGGREERILKVPTWIDQMEHEVLTGRLPQAWLERYKAQYAAWQNGQELPLEGTPIKGWGVLSPAQQETLIRMNIRTVEDLSQITEEGMRYVGAGSVELKRKANAWLAQLQDKGPLTVKMTAVEAENAVLKGSIEALQKQVAALMPAGPAPVAAPVPDEDDLPKGRKR